MIGLTTLLKIVCDKLYELTSNEVVEERPYADTRPSESLYAITSTQPGENTYAAGESQPERAQDDARQSQEGQPAEQFDCEDPRTCPTCNPRTTTAD